jgi:iron complex transport system substrate-binding protein
MTGPTGILCRKCMPAMRSIGLAADRLLTALQAEATVCTPAIEDCGQRVTFTRPPEPVVVHGHTRAETLLLLGLEGKMSAIAFWPNRVAAVVENASVGVEVLTVASRTLKAMFATQPDFVPVMLVTLLEPYSKVAKREDFQRLGIPSYQTPLPAPIWRTSYTPRARRRPVERPPTS